jgi:hypothetical protein
MPITAGATKSMVSLLLDEVHSWAGLSAPPQ